LNVSKIEELETIETAREHRGAEMKEDQDQTRDGRQDVKTIKHTVESVLLRLIVSTGLRVRIGMYNGGCGSAMTATEQVV
jgi:hypothetical protein